MITCTWACTPPPTRYSYEKPGHGWVQRLVERETVPLANPNAIAASLNALLGGAGGDERGRSRAAEAAEAQAGDHSRRLAAGEVWKAGGASGLGGQKIGWSGWVEAPPETVMQALVGVDRGAANT